MPVTSNNKVVKILDLFKNTQLTYHEIAKKVGVGRKVVARVINSNFDFNAIKSRKAINYRLSRLGKNNPSFGRSGSGSPKYKGVISDNKGYCIIIKPEWYSGRKNSKHIFYHHYVICEALNISEIPAGYNVHHCDKDRMNNLIENLILMPCGLHQKLHSFLRHGGIEGVTTISKESTLKWAEARGFRISRNMIWSDLQGDLQLLKRRACRNEAC